MASSLTEPYLPSDLSTSLEGYWPLDNDVKESAATPAFDSSIAAEIMSNIAGSERGFGAKFESQNQSDFDVESVTFRLRKVGTPSVTTARLVARFYSVNSSGLPNTQLAESTTQLHPNDDLTSSFVNYDFDFASGFTMPRKCIIMIEFSDNNYTPSGSNQVNVGQAVLNGNGVPQHRRVQKSNSDTYTDGTGNDLFFEIRGRDVTAVITDDLSSNGNDLTNNGTTFDVQEWGEAYWGDGKSCGFFDSSDNNYLEITDGSQTGLDFTSDWSWFGRARTTSASLQQTFIQKGVTTTSGYRVYISGSGLFRCVIGASDVSSGYTVIRNRWASYGVVYDATNQWVIFYVNGDIVSVVSNTGTLAGTSEPFRIGSRSETAAAFFDGPMRDVAVWSRQLTPLEMKALSTGVDIDRYAYRPGDVGTAPTAYWKLNEVSDGSAAVQRDDSSGNAHHLTDVNDAATLRGYAEGGSADFDNSSTQYFTAADSTDWDFDTGDFSMAAWCYFDIAPSGSHEQHIMGQVQDGSNYRGFYVNNQIHFQQAGLGGAIDIAFNHNASIKADVWHHMACVRRSGTMYFYVNGEERYSVADSTNFNAAAASFKVGGRVTGGETSSNIYAGQMQDASVWKGYGLTEEEVQSLAAGMPVQQSGLVSYWLLDESSGTRSDQLGRNDLGVSGTPSSETNSRTGREMVLLDGSSDFASMSDANQSDLGNGVNWTMTCYHDPDSASGQRHMMSKGDASTIGDFNMRNDGSNNIIVEVGQTGGLNNPSDPRNPTVSRTYFTSFVFYGNGSRIGVEDDTDGWRFADEGLNSKDGVYASNEYTFAIGIERGPTDYYAGGIGDFTFWSRPLTDQELQSVANKGLNTKEVTSTEKGAGNTGGFFALF